MEKVYLNQNGSFPWHDGKPNLITQSDFEDCCCKPPAPGSCPCESWPPESWPCGGMLEQISANYVRTSTYFDNASECTGDINNIIGFRTNGNVVLTADPDIPCMWAAEGTFIQQGEGNPIVWGDPVLGIINVRLGTTPQGDFAWIFDQDDIFYKRTGLTPIGEYNEYNYLVLEETGFCIPGVGFESVKFDFTATVS